MSLLCIGGPPVKEGMLANEVGLLLERQAALGLDLLERGEVGEAHIGEWFVGQRPEMLGGLQFGRVRGQDQDVDPLGDVDFLAGVPARPIEHEEDALGGSCPNVSGEGLEDQTEHHRGDRGKQPPLSLIRNPRQVSSESSGGFRRAQSARVPDGTH